MRQKLPYTSNVPASARQKRWLPEKLQQALSLFRQGQLPRAQRIYEEILATDGRNFEALHNLGTIAVRTGKPKRALQLLDTAVLVNPTNAVAHCSRGTALRALKRWDDALASYDRALAINPAFAGAWCNRIIALQQLGRWEPAMQSCDRAIALDPSLALAYVNRAYLFLRSGDFERGWADYEWRWKAFGWPVRAQPLWLGEESLEGKTILLHAEAGLGDTLQFCRYTSLVSKLGARVILEVPKTLASLLSGLDGVAQVVTPGDPLPSCDYRCPLLSLPFAFKTALEHIPALVPYLRSDERKVREWHAKLGERRQPRIGLVWKGNPEHSDDGHRSISLEHLLRSLPAGFEYVSLQKEIDAAEKRLLRSTSHAIQIPELGDFSDTAAICNCLDRVVSVDTSVAHLSGALGAETWILVQFSPDWRWLLERADSPWYPTAKLYRQPAIADWQSVLDQVKADLIRSLGCA